jgi:hypothetical protein
VTWVPARPRAAALIATPVTAPSIPGVPWMKELAGLVRKAVQADLAAQAFAELETILAPATPDADPSRTLEHARELASGFNAFRRRAATAPGGVVVDDEIARMSPTLTGLTHGLAAVRVTRHAEHAVVLLSAEEILRVVTLLVMSCREALPAGGTVSIETRLMEMEPPIGRSSASIPAVSIQVTRVGLAAMPVEVPSTLATLASACAFGFEPMVLAGSVVGVTLLLPIDGDRA